MESNGLISKTLDWVFHPTFSDQNPVDWFAFFVLAVIVGILWSKVLRQVVEAA